MKSLIAKFPGFLSNILLLSATIFLVGCFPEEGSNNINSTAGSSADIFTPTPDADNFYDAPSEIPDAPGTILKSREITYQPGGIPLPN
ncbi:MAG: hypothetical protein KBT72_10660, partial [Zhongshania sp.]|nr:hypothetical protein [Zhongshania sp.]